MRSTWAKRSGNFTESGSRVKRVLKDILSEVQIKALVIETQVFESFAANSVRDLSRGNVWVIMTWNVPWRFIL
jgi:hypothetical protein